MTWLIQKSEGRFYVGYYDPATKRWATYAEFTTADAAEEKINYLMGGPKPSTAADWWPRPTTGDEVLR